MENKAKFISKGYMTVIIFNVLIHVCLIIIILCIGKTPLSAPPKCELLIFSCEILAGFISSAILLVKTDKGTNVKILERLVKVYFGTYIFLFLLILFAITVARGWPILVLTLVLGIPAFVIMLGGFFWPFGLLYIAIKNQGDREMT